MMLKWSKDMVNGKEAEPETEKKWQYIVNGYFTGPALVIFGCLMLKLVWVAVGLFLLFSLLLFTSGIRRVFHLLPTLTQYLIITAPVVFILGWGIGKIHAGQATASVLFIIYGGLQLISNLLIPPFIEQRQDPER